MTFMKSFLLGSGAAIIAVAGAQAADLPTKKAAPAEYVKICNVGGMAGFVLPGSDTCLKISGYITAQIEGGNTTTGYGRGNVGGVANNAIVGLPNAIGGTSANLRPSLGWTTRANIDFDARTNTAYGVLRGYAELQFENGSGFDTTGSGAYINLAYVQWAGITAGKAPSFFSFFGGGEGWANIFSPDQQGFNQPDLLAYTATFGGGFSATIAIQSAFPKVSPGDGGDTGSNTNYTPFIFANTTNYGQTAPDIVANVRVDQSWGSAQISGVAHQVHVFSTFTGPNAPGPFGVNGSQNTWGWAFDAGVSFNLPQFGAGDKFAIQGVYSKNATWYSGIPDGMWGENGATNGNGLPMAVGDTYFALGNAAGNGGAVTAASWATPTAWSVGATFEHHFSPVFSFDPEVAYAELHWSNSLGNLPTNSQSLIVGAVAHWDPVPQLDFAFELLYQTTHQSTPGVWFAPGGAMTGVTIAPNGVATVGFKNNTDGVAGRFYITRNF
jgi:hypothetical protein